MYSGVGKVSWSLPGPTGTPNLTEMHRTPTPSMLPGQGQVLLSAPACSPEPPGDRSLPYPRIVLHVPAD